MSNTVSPVISNSTEFVELIVDSIQDIKGKNIIQLDMRNIDDAPAEYFIICEGESTTQVDSIAHNVFRRVKDEAELLPMSFEGRDGKMWVLVDYFDVVVHVFYPSHRALYDIEGLWQDAKRTEHQEL